VEVSWYAYYWRTTQGISKTEKCFGW
jgi:hypothetical protein